jgi:hypothetical protein
MSDVSYGDVPPLPVTAPISPASHDRIQLFFKPLSGEVVLVGVGVGPGLSCIFMVLLLLLLNFMLMVNAVVAGCAAVSAPVLVAGVVFGMEVGMDQSFLDIKKLLEVGCVLCLHRRTCMLVAFALSIVRRVVRGNVSSASSPALDCLLWRRCSPTSIECIGSRSSCAVRHRCL